MSAIKTKFQAELKIARDTLVGDNKLTIENYVPSINHIIEMFEEEGHVGAGAEMAIDVISDTLKKVLLQKTLTPLTGDSSEWGDPIPNGTDIRQNKRDGGLFRIGENGRPYYIHAIVWKGEDDGDVFTGIVEGITSRQNVRFPFEPKVFYIPVVKVLFDSKIHNEEEKIKIGDADYVYKIKNKDDMVPVSVYYQMIDESEEE